MCVCGMTFETSKTIDPRGSKDVGWRASEISAFHHTRSRCPSEQSQSVFVPLKGTLANPIRPEQMVWRGWCKRRAWAKIRRFRGWFENGFFLIFFLIYEKINDQGPPLPMLFDATDHSTLHYRLPK